MDDLIPQKWRAYLYRVATAVVPILTVYGVVADNTASLWLGLVGALLGGGAPALAARHTRKPEPDAPDFQDLRDLDEGDLK